MDTITEMIQRGWENFLARPDGPFSFRFFIQPLLGLLMALRAGIHDAQAGRPAFLWDAVFNRAHRHELLRNGWKDVRLPFFISLLLDAIYQLSVHHFIYPLELLFTSVLLAVLPYVLLRGPMNRLARLFVAPLRPGPAGNPPPVPRR